MTVPSLFAAKCGWRDKAGPKLCCQQVCRLGSGHFRRVIRQAFHGWGDSTTFHTCIQVTGWPAGPTFPYFLIQSPTVPYFLKKTALLSLLLGFHVVKLKKEHFTCHFTLIVNIKFFLLLIKSLLQLPTMYINLVHFKISFNKT